MAHIRQKFALGAIRGIRRILCFNERSFGLFARARITDQGGVKARIPEHGRADTKIDGEFAAVFAPAQGFRTAAEYRASSVGENLIETSRSGIGEIGH